MRREFTELSYRVFFILILQIPSLFAQPTVWTQVYQTKDGVVGICWGENKNIIILDSHVGIFGSPDRGATWNLLQENLFKSSLFSLTRNSRGMLFSSGGGYRARSSDNGSSWEYVLYSSYVSNTPVVVTPNNYLFVGNWRYKGNYPGGIDRSTNDGAVWSYLHLNEDIQRLVTDPLGNIYAFTAYNGTRVSSDYGESWSNIIIPPFSSIISGKNGKLFAGSLSGIYVSSDNGKSWTSVGFVDLTVRTMLIDSRGFVYAATNNGMFKSSNDGDTWIEINSGLTDLNILCATITPDDYIFIGTLRKGVFKSTDPVTEIERGLFAEPPRSFLLLQNFPNPFNPTTNFEFQLPHKGYVTLRVFDLLGRKLATLVNEEKAPGVYKASWDASEFPSGVYLYQLRADNFIETKKMVLMK